MLWNPAFVHWRSSPSLVVFSHFSFLIHTDLQNLCWGQRVTHPKILNYSITASWCISTCGMSGHPKATQPFLRAHVAMCHFGGCLCMIPCVPSEIGAFEDRPLPPSPKKRILNSGFPHTEHTRPSNSSCVRHKRADTMRCQMANQYGWRL